MLVVSFDGEHLTLEVEVWQIGQDRFSNFRTIACCSAAKAVGVLVAARVTVNEMLLLLLPVCDEVHSELRAMLSRPRWNFLDTCLHHKTTARTANPASCRLAYF